MERTSRRKFLELLEERFPGIRVKIEARYTKDGVLGKAVRHSTTGQLRADIRDKQEAVFILKGVRAMAELEGTTFPFNQKELQLLDHTETHHKHQP